MSAFPPAATPLTEIEKGTYRWLLYMGFLDIRALCQGGYRKSLNPIVRWRQYVSSQIAGALADWLHNLAYQSSADFRGFNVDYFWHQYNNLMRRYADFKPGAWLDYRTRYDDELARRGGA